MARAETTELQLMTDQTDQLRRWDALTDDEQTALRIAFGQYQDRLPSSCSLETKVQRFGAWLREHGVDYVEQD